MEQYLNKHVIFTGTSNLDCLKKGEIYPVSHTYGGNVGLKVAPNKYVSINPKKVEILDPATLQLPSSPDIKVHTILTLDREPVGIRFKSSKLPFFDIELSALEGVNPLALEIFKTEPLLPFGHFLMTEAEQQLSLVVLDLSTNLEYCNYIKNTLLP